MRARTGVCVAAALLGLVFALAGSAGAQGPIDFFLPIPNPIFANRPGTTTSRPVRGRSTGPPTPPTPGATRFGS
jgi:hypothetical protein